MAVLDSLGLKTSNGAGIFSEQTNKVAAAYLSITQTSFKYNYSMNSDPDITDLKAEIYPLAETGIKDTLVKYFPVETKILKLKNSVGIAFSHFPGSYHSYFVKPDTTIGKERGNLFVPILATYVHFYSSGRSGFKWGGTIGFGIPLFGEEKDFHFLLGISAILGRNEMVIISAGASGTKVNKLKSNYKVGDKVLPQDVNSLTKPVYDAGVFFSVSINFGSVNQRK
jgi:hypothetical protein